MKSIHRLGERLVALFLLGLLLLNPPLLTIFDSPNTIAEIPTLYLYLFAAWFLLIILLALVTELTPPAPDDEVTADAPIQSSGSHDPEGV